MDVSKLLAELRAERALLDEVITNLEQISEPKKKRGRPRRSAVPVTRFAEDTEEAEKAKSAGDTRAAAISA